MRSLRIMGPILAIAAILTAAASAAELPAKRFSLVIQGHFGRRWVAVFRDPSGWACATESMPYFASRGNPLADLDWTALAKASSGASCHDTALIEDRRGPSARTARGCASEGPFKSLIERLDQRCRAE